MEQQKLEEEKKKIKEKEEMQLSEINKEIDNEDMDYIFALEKMEMEHIFESMKGKRRKIQ